MPVLKKLAALVKDPPPAYLFELSEAGLAYARGTETGFLRFDPGSLLASPVEDNLLRADAIRAAIAAAAPANGAPGGGDFAGLRGARGGARLRFVSFGAGGAAFAGAVSL
jgi:hypothetical protein